jgi:hypothetical protein
MWIMLHDGIKTSKELFLLINWQIKYRSHSRNGNHNDRISFRRVPGPLLPGRETHFSFLRMVRKEN